MLASVLFLVTVNSLVNLPFLNCLEMLEIKPGASWVQDKHSITNTTASDDISIPYVSSKIRVWSECLYPSRTCTFKSLPRRCCNKSQAFGRKVIRSRVRRLVS